MFLSCLAGDESSAASNLFQPSGVVAAFSAQLMIILNASAFNANLHLLLVGHFNVVER